MRHADTYSMRVMAVLGTLFLLIGCASSATFTRTGDYLGAPQFDDDCSIVAYTMIPRRKFREIGTINYFRGDTNGAISPDHAINLAREDICRHGGNGLILWESNAVGEFKVGTAIYVEPDKSVKKIRKKTTKRKTKSKPKRKTLRKSNRL